ncbi:hypothetical protein [Thalassobacillus sp. C254]|uniref:hypothetical protein n=1 Tax=Thalassobacillus sp. C254 TaxID=1225341 RepID=UPI0006D25BB4|nr:hypothetical protein [Thalassobacillus sp. C254]
MSKDCVECAICGQELEYKEDRFKNGNHGEPVCLTKEECKEPEEWAFDVESDDDSQPDADN